MKAIVFGGTGMVGQGVLHACLRADDVTTVLVIGRSTSGVTDPKVREILRHDFYDYSDIANALVGYDACFFCLGVSSIGMSEEEYHRLTFDLTLSAAQALVERNPTMTFCYVSGAGTDSTERGRVMWARVKGKTENHLLQLPFEAVYLFRPGFIQPLDGIRSKTRLYRAVYAVFGRLYPVLKRALPNAVTDTTRVGRAMIRVAREGYARQILENKDINSVAA
jgi:uncharacterized protein YbjT (DUF2867 family)